MSRRSTVLIAAAELLPAFTARMQQPDVELLAFSDADALKAFDVIMRRRPDVVALDQRFAAAPRGAALIERIKADSSLAATEIRILSPRAPSHQVAPLAGASDSAQTNTPSPLDVRGTRRTPRFKMAPAVEGLIDGNRAELVDLSIGGAQVVSAMVLKPNQRVRLSLADEVGTLRISAVVAWAAFEMPPETGPRYRAGLEFIGADARSIEAYCSRHQA